MHTEQLVGCPNCKLAIRMMVEACTPMIFRYCPFCGEGKLHPVGYLTKETNFTHEYMNLPSIGHDNCTDGGGLTLESPPRTPETEVDNRLNCARCGGKTIFTAFYQFEPICEKCFNVPAPSEIVAKLNAIKKAYSSISGKKSIVLKGHDLGHFDMTPPSALVHEPIGLDVRKLLGGPHPDFSYAERIATIATNAVKRSNDFLLDITNYLHNVIGFSIKDTNRIIQTAHKYAAEGGINYKSRCPGLNYCTFRIDCAEPFGAYTSHAVFKTDTKALVSISCIRDNEPQIHYGLSGELFERNRYVNSVLRDWIDGRAPAPVGFDAATFAVVDDPIVPSEAISELELERANQWMRERGMNMATSSPTTTTAPPDNRKGWKWNADRQWWEHPDGRIVDNEGNVHNKVEEPNANEPKDETWRDRPPLL